MGARTKSQHTEPNHLPTVGELQAADAATLFSSDGKPTTFGVIRAAQPGRRLTLVFVRHWHCGLCAGYVSTLADEPAFADERVVIVGHGAAEGIERYREISGARSTFEIYADPKKVLFSALGVTRRSLDMGEKAPRYQKGSTLAMVLSGVRESLGSGLLAFKGGDIAQLGAEFVFNERGEAVFAHRMVNTRDHTEVPDLVQVLRA
ncbi:L-rhamnose-1-dehydrogenase [Tilletia horrida]|uniref:L-rhamnose-1-dehydrogenase n=1 Tax=Tilletia horrida TaxID=155126 RepID=A0AAN6JME2_9BASI|nr:L-rhamnose-1-dehydrogenase [Tilletia horrida]KAK0564091.1 L-rhamnose-1-dehydrogenase [Tilletia horrida]